MVSFPCGWKGQENNPLLTPAQPCHDEMLTAGKHLLAPAELGFPLPSLPDTQPPDHTSVPIAKGMTGQILSVVAELTCEIHNYISSGRNYCI